MSASAGGGGGSAAAGGGGGASGNIVLTSEKLRGEFDYIGFHIADTLKDASASPTLSPSDNTLFKECMKQLYGERYTKKQYDTLKRIYSNILFTSVATEISIDRLDRKGAVAGKATTDIPSILKYVIRDTGGIADHSKFSSDTKNLGNIGDFTDAAKRSAALSIGGSRFFPEIGKEMRIDNSVFEFMLGRSIIRDFVGKINADHSCTVRFSINGISYTGNIDNKFNRSGHAIYMMGTPIKNIWFNTNEKNINTANIQEGIVYLLCKEMFGDVLLALIGLAFKGYSDSYGGEAAVFTGDNSLTSLCIHLHVNVVSLMRDAEAKSSKCTAYLFTDPIRILLNEKVAAVTKYIQNNIEIIGDLQNMQAQIAGGISINIQNIVHLDERKDPRIRENISSFLQYIIEIIQAFIIKLESIRDGIINVEMNKYIEDEIHIENSEQDLDYFKGLISRFNCPTLIRIVLTQGGQLHHVKFSTTPNPFKSVNFHRNEFRDIAKSTTTMAQKISQLVHSYRGGQRGGGLAPMKGGNFSALKKEYAKGNGMQYDPFNLDEELKNPTAYLRKVINEVLTKHRPAIRLTESASYEEGGSELVYIDDLDVYELLYPIYEVSGTINYDPNFILFAINAYLVSYSPEAPSLMEFYHTEILKVPFPSSSKPVPRVGTPLASPATSKKRPLERSESIEENEVRHLPPGYRPRTPPKKTAYAGGRRGKRITRKKVNYKRRTRR